MSWRNNACLLLCVDMVVWKTIHLFNDTFPELSQQHTFLWGYLSTVIGGSIVPRFLFLRKLSLSPSTLSISRRGLLTKASCSLDRDHINVHSHQSTAYRTVKSFQDTGSVKIEKDMVDLTPLPHKKFLAVGLLQRFMLQQVAVKHNMSYLNISQK